jgi:hypothetical protein
MLLDHEGSGDETLLGVVAGGAPAPVEDLHETAPRLGLLSSLAPRGVARWLAVTSP